MTYEECILRIAGQFRQSERLQCNRIHVVGIRRSEVSSRVSDVAIRPVTTFLLCCPDRSSRSNIDIIEGQTQCRSTSRDKIDRQVADMEIVVTVCFGRFTIESNLHILACIGAEVNLYGLTTRSSVDVIIYISGTRIGPLCSNVPLVVRINQHSKHIVFLTTCGNSATFGFGQSEVEAQLIASLHLDRRAYDPVITCLTKDIQIEVIRRIREDVVFRTFRPT